MNGVELEMVASPIAGLTLSGGFSTLDSEITKVTEDRTLCSAPTCRGH